MSRALLMAMLLTAAVSARDADTWRRPEADRRVPLRVVNTTGRAAVGYPYWVSLDSLAPLGRVHWRAARLVSAAGKELPCQVDDLNRNGRCDADDAFAALLDVPKGETTCYLYLPRDAKAPGVRPRPAVVAKVDAKARTARIDNGLVRVTLSTRPGWEGRQAIERKHRGRWLTLASEWGDSLMLDGKWPGWKTVASRVRVVGVGPARGVLRHTMQRRADATGKSVSIFHDYSVFAGRGEIASALTLANTSKDQMVALTRWVSGFYAVSPGGAYDFTRDRYAGVERSGKLVSGALKTTGFRVRRAGYRRAMWCGAQAGEGRPPLGFGLVVERPLHSIYALCVADVFRRGKHKLRMSVYYIFRENTLWPGQTFSILHWYCPHVGASKTVADFRDLRNGIRVTPGEMEWR